MADSVTSLPQHFGTKASSSQPPRNTAYEDTPPITAGQSDADSHYIPRPKRIACVLCRRRKLRCDGKRPSCGTCSRLGHECIFDEVRKKSGPKRGYVKQLEARLAQVETLLKSQETRIRSAQGNGPIAPATTDDSPDAHGAFPLDDVSMSSPDGATDPALSAQVFQQTRASSRAENEGGLISLGLEEPLPTREVIDELTTIYFEKIYPGMPMIHRPRYLAATILPPASRPPICLQYMIWCHAASVSDKYSSLHNIFYLRARKYAELDELKGFGECMVTLAHCQTWLLITTYEFRMMLFPRAWLSAGQAARLAVMLGLNRLDGQGLDVKQTLSPPKDWTEEEERRRVLWLTFCVDRYASVGTGWPVTLDERDISTKLPSSEESFLQNKPQQSVRLADALNGGDISLLSPFGGVVVLACMFGRNIPHLHRPEPGDNDHDLTGGYWQRHRALDNILLHFALSMPSHLRLTVATTDPNVIFCNMAIHTATICLHQAAIFKAEKNKMPEQIATECKRRCILAADQISNIMKMISHLDLSIMNPFMAFCVYVAARVFIQYLKFRPNDSAARSSLQFAFSSLQALKDKNPLAESFIAQLDLDIGGTAFGDVRENKACFTARLPSARTSGDPSPENTNQPRAHTDGLSPDIFPSASGLTPSSLSSRQTTTETPSETTSDHLTITKNGKVATDPNISPSRNANISANNLPLNSTSAQPTSSYMISNYTPSQQLPLDPQFFSPSIFAPFQYTSPSFSNQSILLESTEPENQLPDPPVWDTSNVAVTDLTSGNMDTPSTGFGGLNDAQWTQLLTSGDWESWQGLNLPR